MKVKFQGGPLDGELREIAGPAPEPDWPLYWSIAADTEVGPAATRQEDVAEYLYRGHGTADYVAGGAPGAVRPGLT